jgi:hypothetical protein
MTSDPISDPQPGDEMRGGCYIRKVIRREGDKVLIEGWKTHYWMRVDRWREWCEKNGAQAAPASAKVRSAKAKGEKDHEC